MLQKRIFLEIYFPSLLIIEFWGGKRDYRPPNTPPLGTPSYSEASHKEPCTYPHLLTRIAKGEKHFEK